MGDGGQQRKSSRRDQDDVEAVEVSAPDKAGQSDEAAQAGDIDELLDEIDAVLEENPEDFVRNYVQKGGQ